MIIKTKLNNNTSGKGLIDTRELTNFIGQSERQIRRLRGKGMPSLSIGRSIRFCPDDVMEWLKDHFKSKIW